MAICSVCHRDSYGAFCSSCGAPLALGGQQPDTGESAPDRSGQQAPSWQSAQDGPPYGHPGHGSTTHTASSVGGSAYGAASYDDEVPSTGQSFLATPSTPSRRSNRIPRPVLIGGAAVLVAALAITFTVGRSRSGRTAVPSYTQPAVTYAPATTTAPTTNSQTFGATGSSTTSGTLTETSAKSWLAMESTSYSVDTDGHYLVQLSAKYYGLIDPQQTAANGSHTFLYADIVSDYQRYRERYGSDIHLVRSTQFGKQSSNSDVPDGESMYLTIYDPQTFGSKDAAESWCESAFPALSGATLDNACLARSASAPHS